MGASRMDASKGAGAKMKNDIAIPPLLRSRPKFQGMVVPFTVAKVGGAWDFKAIDQTTADWCLKHRCCGMCGYLMTGPLAFIGGEESMKNRQFTDVPMHPLCARYALKVCPFLTGAKKEYATTLREGTEVIQGVEMLTSPRMGIGFTDRYTTNGRVILAGPWDGEIEWYDRNGGADRPEAERAE